MAPAKKSGAAGGVRGGGLIEATESAIKAATHLTDMDAGAVQALRELARKIDAWDVIVDWALDDAAGTDGARPTVPQNDNVSLSAYLKYCDQLGLSPAGRKALALKEAAGGGKSATLKKLRGDGRPQLTAVGS